MEITGKVILVKMEKYPAVEIQECINLLFNTQWLSQKIHASFSATYIQTKTNYTIRQGPANLATSGIISQSAVNFVLSCVF